MRAAASLPFCICSASVTSSSGVSRSTLPISLRYMRTGSSIAKVSAMAEVSISSSSGTSSTASGSNTSSSSSSPSAFSRTPPVSISTPIFSSVSYSLSISSLSSSSWPSASAISLSERRPFFLPSASRSRRTCCWSTACSGAFVLSLVVISFVLPRFVF